MLLCPWFLLLSAGLAGTVEHIGSYANWTTTWQPFTNGAEIHNVGVDDTLDFVGDITNPGLYWSSSDEYIFFRMRVDAETFTTATGAHILLIDIVGLGNDGIDYGFAWDSKSNKNSAHGLEMSVPDPSSTDPWSATLMDDMDGLGGSKGVNDINGDLRNTDGYVRSIDGQAATNFGNTTFIDFAVKWSYLEYFTGDTAYAGDYPDSGPGLRRGQSWNIAVAGIDNATDHLPFNADVGGGADLTSSTTVGWSSAILVPEPSTALMMGLAGFFALSRRKRPGHL